MSQTANYLVLAALALIAGASTVIAQDADLMPAGSRGVCATADVNDPVRIREAWTNTLALHPGIAEAVRSTNLQRSTLDYRVGDQNLFWVYNIQKRVFDTVRAELKAIGTISYVWVALGEWNNSHITATEVTAIGNALEKSTNSGSLDSTKGILQIDRQVYGDPPNINTGFQKGKGDGKTHFLLCDIQDGWSGTGSYVAGFFYSVDVDPNSGFADRGSNRRDILYIDSYPGVFVNGRYRTSTALSTLAHEFQHLIHWNYDPNEVTFFNEGLAEYAEFLCGFDLRSPFSYFGNVNLSLTLWNGTIEDYSRAALWTRFCAEQYGTTFLKNFVQNSNTGIPSFDQALGQTGFASTFSTTLQNFFVANWLGMDGIDPKIRYNAALAGKPKLRGEYVDPNVQKTDTIPPQAVHYVHFESARNFRALFTLPVGVVVRAVERGPSALRVRDVIGGTEFTSQDLGTFYSSVDFVIINSQVTQSAVYSYAVTGELLHFIVEESHDSGTPHVFSAGFAPYLGFGNNSATRGMAVRFQPAVNGNVLRKARMLLMFNQEFSNGTALPADNKDFLFHIWGDRNGRPGDDLLKPFLVTVDRNAYPLDNFVDIDLSPYQNLLSKLTGPIYIGFMEDTDDSVGTYVAVDNLTTDDFSYVYRGPNHPIAPNTWQTMREVSALNNHSLDGFNLMMRAVFEYSDSSSAPKLSLGYLQNPILSEYIDVVATSPDDLRLASLSGTLAQGTSQVALRFTPIPGTAKAFVDTSQQLKASGTITLRVRGARKYGVFYSDTSVAVSAKLMKRNEPATLATPSGAAEVSFDAASFAGETYVTAVDGANNTILPQNASSSGIMTAFFGPAGLRLNRPSQIRVSCNGTNEPWTLARLRDGRWYSIPTISLPDQHLLVGTTNELGLFGIVQTSEVVGALDEIPARFALYQNYPNPFNPSTTIEFDLPVPAMTRLVVYDVLGKVVSRLADGERPAGNHRVLFNAVGLSSGIYYYRLTAGGFSQVRKLVLLK